METIVLLGVGRRNLAVAVTAAARDQGLPLPARIAVLSPFADVRAAPGSKSANIWILATRAMPTRPVGITLPVAIRATRGARDLR